MAQDHYSQRQLGLWGLAAKTWNKSDFARRETHLWCECANKAREIGIIGKGRNWRACLIGQAQARLCMTTHQLYSIQPWMALPTQSTEVDIGMDTYIYIFHQLSCFTLVMKKLESRTWSTTEPNSIIYLIYHLLPVVHKPIVDHLVLYSSMLMRRNPSCAQSYRVNHRLPWPPPAPTSSGEIFDFSNLISVLAKLPNLK